MKFVARHTLALIYMLAIVLANLLIFTFGPWFSPVNAFLLIGLDLSLRDALHEKYNGDVRIMSALILTASAVTLVLNPTAWPIALASTAAFSLSSIADWLTYSSLHKQGFLVKSNGSNVVGAAVDSLVFPTLAFGALLPWVVAGQFFSKLFGGFLWSLVIRKVGGRA